MCARGPCACTASYATASPPHPGAGWFLQAAELWLMAVEVMPASSPEFGRLGEMLGMACAKVAKKAASGGLGQAAAALVGKAR